MGSSVGHSMKEGYAPWLAATNVLVVPSNERVIDGAPCMIQRNRIRP